MSATPRKDSPAGAGLVKIEVLVVGQPKAGFASRGVAHYSKLLSGLASLEVAAVKPGSGAAKPSPQEVMTLEAERILKRAAGSAKVVALDVKGQKASSEKLLGLFKSWERAGLNRLTFVIGGAWGLDPAVLERADLTLSLSAMTFSHELSLLMLLEQIYRAFSIKAGRPYAK